MTSPESAGQAALQARLDELSWHHAIDVAPGVVTKGTWDLRHALPALPFPDVRGKRCIDIGTKDGFYAFEMERRGAAEVVAVDVAELAQVDYPPEVRHDPHFARDPSDEQRDVESFELLREILDSKVQWRGVSAYDLDPEQHGTFDVAVMGDVLVHMRDPVRAPYRVRTIPTPGGQLISVDAIDPVTNLSSFGRPTFRLRGRGTDFEWWAASEAGLRDLLWVGGFEIEGASKRFLARPGAAGTGAHPGLHGRLSDALRAAYSGDRTPNGSLHRAALSHRRF
jgi:tRNA (mo5U34)-methyltransferase